MADRTLVLVKPDGVRRGLVGEVIARLERKGLTLAALELGTLDREKAEQHYAEHKDKDFFGELVDFITSGPLVAMVVEGARVVEAVRAVMGATDPVKAEAGSLRGQFAVEIGQNLVHGSDSAESAQREIGLFFPALGEQQGAERTRDATEPDPADDDGGDNNGGDHDGHNDGDEDHSDDSGTEHGSADDENDA